MSVLPWGEARRLAFVEEIGQQGRELPDAVFDPNGFARSRQSRILPRVWIQNYQRIDNVVRWRIPPPSRSIENWKPAPDPCTERERLTRYAERQDRYEQVATLRAQGMGNTEIARRLGLTARTLQNWQKKGFPEHSRRRKRSSCFDPYAPYVLIRWEQGCTNGLQIYREIKEQGYRGTEKTVYRFLVPLCRNSQVIQKAAVPHVPLQDFSAKDAVWLFVRERAKLDEKEQATLTAICEASETARTTYLLVQEFRDMLHARSGEKLDGWLEAVKASQIRELQSFVAGVARDKAAVLAGLTLPQNNGLLEGKVHTLKLIKRMGYGKAAKQTNITKSGTEPFYSTINIRL